MLVCVSVRDKQFVCVREGERERGMSVCERECVYVCHRERMCARERKTECVCVGGWVGGCVRGIKSVCVCASVCMCTTETTMADLGPISIL